MAKGKGKNRIPRRADGKVKGRKRTPGAVNVVGAKGAGKTKTMRRTQGTMKNNRGQLKAGGGASD